MIRANSFLRDASGFVRTLLLVYWLGAATLIALLLLAGRWVETRRSVLVLAENAINMVEASLVTSSSVNDRQALIEASTDQLIGRQTVGLQALLVVNREGRIVHSSRPAWLGVRIDDGIFRGASFNDTHFQEIAACFRDSRPNCVNQSSHNLSPFGSSFTVYRTVFTPSRDLGLPREPFLVLVTYSGLLESISFFQDLLPALLVALLVAGLMGAVLWLCLRFLLLPRLSLLAQTDGLTGLMNRAAFMELAMDVLAEGEEAGVPLVFALLDVDLFKEINDSYGHDCGDEALVSVSAVLATVIRGDDLVCRFGGEEFALLLASDEETGRKVLERLRLQLEMNRVAYAGREIPVSVSIGAAATAEHGYNIDYLYTSADRALYAAKKAGRNRVEWAGSRSVGRLQLSAPVYDAPRSQDPLSELLPPSD